jgi:hypothetical protein
LGYIGKKISKLEVIDETKKNLKPNYKPKERCALIKTRRGGPHPPFLAK